jgi:hypothetical protein
MPSYGATGVASKSQPLQTTSFIMARPLPRSSRAESASCLSLRDHHRGHEFNVWTVRDEQLGWSWCFTIDRSSDVCTHDVSFKSEAMALLNGEAAARMKIDSLLDGSNWRHWVRQQLTL